MLGGTDAACVKCHRRSGLGSSEGRNNIRPIAGRLLFPTTQADEAAIGRGVSAGAIVVERPTYSEAGLMRALREGVDPSGRVLDPLMPRYTLSDAEGAHLHAYLGKLSSGSEPGVSDTSIHFATIIAPGVSPGRKQAMLDVLQAFFKDKNGGTRKETRRRDVGREQMYRAYRSWVLHPWELTGSPETWRDQLAAYYRQQPVFAVIGGLGGGSWQPVHAFCEAFEVPCVFPDVDYPAFAGTDYYPLYLSRGVTLEAEVLAKYLQETSQPGKATTIMQVYRDNALGRLPAQALRGTLQGRSGTILIDYPLAESSRMPAEWLAKSPGKARLDVLVSWLDSASFEALACASAPPAGVAHVYVSASLSAMRRPDLPEPWLDRLRMVYPFDLPANREPRMARMKVWLRARNIPLTDERTQANAFFAATVTGDAVSHMGENFSRDYLIERIEQMTQISLSPSIYPHPSLGPGQRFASKGGYIVRFPAGERDTPVAISEWLVP